MFVCGDADRCAEYAAPFSQAGWDTRTVSPDSPDSLALIESAAPMATVFDLDASSGVAIGALATELVSDPNLPRPLFVFVGGDQATIDAMKIDVPFGVFVKPDELAWVLKHLVYKE